MKRTRNCPNEKLNQAVLLTFIKQARTQNLPLSGELIKEKAKEYARRLSILGFCASDGWLSKF